MHNFLVPDLKILFFYRARDYEKFPFRSKIIVIVCLFYMDHVLCKLI